ncbi:MAG: hypothetical protein ACRD4B_07755, partial [Acidobacteriota bacterium]
MNSGVLAPLTASNQLVLGGNTVTDFQFEVNGKQTGKALVSLNETGDQDILTASASGTTVFNLDRSGNLAVEGALSDLSGATLAVNDNLSVSGTITGATNETINGIDISSGTVSDVVNLTINSGGDLTIGTIGLNDVGTSNTDSGASLIGVFDEFANSSATNVQDVLDDFDAAIGAGSSKWTASNDVLYPNQIANQVGIGTQSEGDVISSLYVTRNLASGALGKSVAIFNQTEDQDILTASASGTTRLTLSNSGNLNIIGGAYQVGGTSVLNGTTLGSTVVNSSLQTVGTINSGTWNGTAIGAQFGGTGDDTSGTTGVPYISSGNWQYETALDETRGGTGLSSYATGD